MFFLSCILFYDYQLDGGQSTFVYLQLEVFKTELYTLKSCANILIRQIESDINRCIYFTVFDEKKNSCRIYKKDLFFSHSTDIVSKHNFWSSYVKVSKGAKIRNRYNQVPHLTQDTNGKVTNSQNTTNESQEVSPFPAGDHKAQIERRAQRHSKHKTEQKHKRSTKEVPPWNGQ